jgi:hypothetical protein
MAHIKKNKTITDAVNNYTDSSSLKRKIKIPEPDKEMSVISVKIPKNYKEDLDKYFKEEGTNMSVVVRKFLIKYYRELYSNER